MLRVEALTTTMRTGGEKLMRLSWLCEQDVSWITLILMVAMMVVAEVGLCNDTDRAPGRALFAKAGE